MHTHPYRKASKVADAHDIGNIAVDEPVEGTSLAFGDLMAQVEEILNNPNADKDDLERAKGAKTKT